MAGMEGMLDAFWDMPMVSGIAFHPRSVQPTHVNATSGPIRDGTFNVSGGDTVSYRFHVPAEDVKVEAVVLFFHGNAEVCTALDHAAELIHKSGAALLSVDYRGFAWGTGQPSLTKLCDDADACLSQCHALLDAAGFGTAKIIVMGRSIGATCAVHLAARQARCVYGLVVDSGLMSIKQLPMVVQFAPLLFGPQAPQMLEMLKEPFDTISKLDAISCPTLVMHGDKDEIVPVAQGVLCHERVPAKERKLHRWPNASHNDVLVQYQTQWSAALIDLLGKALEFENQFPAGALVEVHVLPDTPCNGFRGRIVGPLADRMRVLLPDPHGEMTFEPANLKIVEEQGSPSTERTSQ